MTSALSRGIRKCLGRGGPPPGSPPPSKETQVREPGINESRERSDPRLTFYSQSRTGRPRSSQQISKNWELSQRLEKAEHRRLQKRIGECTSSTKWDQGAKSGLLAWSLSVRDFYMRLEVWHSVFLCLSAVLLGFS